MLQLLRLEFYLKLALWEQRYFDARYEPMTNPIFGFVRNQSGERHSYATQSGMAVGAVKNWVRFIIFRGSHGVVPDGVESRNRRCWGVSRVVWS